MDPIQKEIVELKMRVERLEEILRQMGHHPIPAGPIVDTSGAPAWENEVRQLVVQRNMLEAIKVYREHTGCSLLEAKMRVEAMG